MATPNLDSNKLIIRCVVRDESTGKEVSRGAEVEYIGTIADQDALAESTLESCIKKEGIIETIGGCEVVNVTPIPQPKPAAPKAAKPKKTKK